MNTNGDDIKPFRVLSLYGGGMRGLYTASLLETLAQRFDKFKTVDPDLGKVFDLICGTSTGAILASALALGISLKKVQGLYIEKGKTEQLCKKIRKNGKLVYTFNSPETQNLIRLGAKHFSGD